MPQSTLPTIINFADQLDLSNKTEFISALRLGFALSHQDFVEAQNFYTATQCDAVNYYDWFIIGIMASIPVLDFMKEYYSLKDCRHYKINQALAQASIEVLDWWIQHVLDLSKMKPVNKDSLSLELELVLTYSKANQFDHFKHICRKIHLRLPMPFKYIASFGTLEIIFWLVCENYKIMHSTNWELDVERPTLEKLSYLRDKCYFFLAGTLRRNLSRNLILPKPSLDNRIHSWSNYAYGYHYDEDVWCPPNIQLFYKYYKVYQFNPDYDVLEFFNQRRYYSKFNTVIQVAVATNNFKILNWLEQKNLIRPFKSEDWSKECDESTYLDICEDCCRFGNLKILRYY